MTGSIEPELTDDELATYRYLEDLAQVVNQQLDRDLERRRTRRLMQGFFSTRAADSDVTTQEAFAWIESHWMCLQCRGFFGPENDDCRPVCDKCRAAVRRSS